jgi:hypothetical protein
MRSWNVSARQGTAIACTNVRAITNVRMSLCSGWSRRGFGRIEGDGAALDRQTGIRVQRATVLL